MTEIMTVLEKRFGKFTITRGKVHDYLGMHIVLRDDNKVEIDMIESITKIIEEFSEEIKGSVTSPANQSLYEPGENENLLSNEKHDEFHSVTQKLLYIMKRSRPDIEPSVAYFCTRVTKSTVSDWWKLKRTLKFLLCTITDKRIIGMTTDGIM